MKKIGIDGSRAFLENRTGIEEYSYQVIKNLAEILNDQQVVLYIRKPVANLGTKSPIGDLVPKFDFKLPENWKIKVIKWPFFWTQIGLSLEMLLHPVEILFVPAHTVPLIHPARNATLLNSKVVWFLRRFFNTKEELEYLHSVACGPQRTIVTIHGLEYEFCPKAYSFWERIYMRVSIRKSCQWASKIISVSENTKKDLMKLYKVPEEKIDVIYEGCAFCHSGLDPESRIRTQTQILKQVQDDNNPYLLFLGRIEERKNVGNIIKAFEILKEKYQLEHKLVLAGKPGFGYESIKSMVHSSRFTEGIVELGFVSEEEKWELLKKAEVFVFPTQYEGFGIPILEAQSVGCPVVASNNSSIPEITCPKAKPSEHRRFSLPEFSALLVNPQNPSEIAEAIFKIISDQTFKKDLIEKGLENVKRFSWEKCAREVAWILKR